MKARKEVRISLPGRTEAVMTKRVAKKLEDQVSDFLEPQHTPTPWVMKAGMSLGGGSYFVGETADGKNTPFQALKKEDAAFIVRAVNCHEELLDMVKGFICGDATVRSYPIMVEKAKKLIAKAEGK